MNGQEGEHKLRLGLKEKVEQSKNSEFQFLERDGERDSHAVTCK